MVRYVQIGILFGFTFSIAMQKNLEVNEINSSNFIFLTILRN